ncbi:PREDICTED: alpha-crystallin B chain isoform X3 [Rhinopithecus bieti]|uniref:alpha-crystallin B chain isoform X3 n=1 Tax=Rhinopithecus bieti TaxID=61621 RepID=UPI00083C361B|nr:PREDICTED: alpha-crystallin B chain isoform X3 [Rhinopithecus bieti]
MVMRRPATGPARLQTARASPCRPWSRLRPAGSRLLQVLTAPTWTQIFPLPFRTRLPGAPDNNQSRHGPPRELRSLPMVWNLTQPKPALVSECKSSECFSRAPPLQHWNLREWGLSAQMSESSPKPRSIQGRRQMAGTDMLTITALFQGLTKTQ